MKVKDAPFIPPETQDPTGLYTFQAALAEGTARGYTFEQAKAVYTRRTGKPCPFEKPESPTALPGVSLDFETRSECDLPDHGAYVYAEHPSTVVLCLAYALDGDPGLWIPDLPFPPVLLEAITAGCPLWAWNVEFEQAIWARAVKLYGFPEVPDSQWRDSMAAAAAMALPQSLDKCGAALGLAVQKDKEGKAVMMRLSKPRRPTKGDDSKYENRGDLFEKLYAYCKQDVMAERAVGEAIPPLSADEAEVWRCHNRINRRGIAADRVGILAALRMVALAEADYRHQVEEATGGLLANDDISSHVKLREWLTGRGFPLPGVAKDVVDEALARTDLPADVRTVLTARRALGRTSTKKYQAMLDRMSADDRIRGTLAYHGAATGRWAGRGIQPQNLPKGDLSPAAVDACLADMATASFEDFRFVWGDPMASAAACVRGCLVAGPGKVLLAADYASIEARVTLWLAGDPGLEVFRRNEDIYRVMAAAIYRIPVDTVSKAQRQLGKIAILGLGYGMGWEKFVATCAAWGIAIDEALARRVVDTFRDKYAMLVGLWKAIETAAIEAVRNGVMTRIREGLVCFKMRGPHLCMRLPSGRVVTYPFAEIRPRVTPWGKETTAVTYMTEDQTTRQWVRDDTYGGKLVENAVQAIARDIMAHAIVACEAYDPMTEDSLYPVVCTVHDEIISEVDESRGTDATVRDFERLLTTLPAWATGCPIAAEGWYGKRYRK